MHTNAQQPTVEVGAVSDKRSFQPPMDVCRENVTSQESTEGCRSKASNKKWALKTHTVKENGSKER